METPSFLPEDYLAEKAQRRTNIICLGLFVIVWIGVFAAFLVTNRHSTQVKRENERINTRYQEAALQIQQLTELESQMKDMLQKAELAAALVERVPRSVLLAELVNRMPPRLSLTELDLRSEEVKKPTNPTKKDEGLARPKRAKTKQEALQETEQVVAPPRYRVTIEMTGVAPTDLEVSSYLTELNRYALLERAELQYSVEKEFEGQTVREFRISMVLPPSADVRQIEPTDWDEIRNPMSDELQFKAPGRLSNAPVAEGD